MCEILNNTWPSSPIVTMTFDSGEITEYARTDKHRERDMYRVPLDAPSDIDIEHAGAYKEILNNPALYSLCSRSPNANAWLACAGRAGWDKKKSVLIWIYRFIRHEGARK